MRLLLIRHGQTQANVDGLLNTAAPGPGLTELGVRQAAEVPVALLNDPIDGIFASELIRTQLTAAPLARDRGLDITVLPGMQEIEAGDLEDRSDKAAIKIFLTTTFAWGQGDLDVLMPGGTDGHAFFRRFDDGIATVAHLPTAVVFNHGSAIRVWVAARAINIPPKFAGDHDLGNTGVIELDGSPEQGWRLLSWQGTPVGGADLIDATAPDPTGESLDDL